MNASIDENSVKSILGILNTDGKTIIPIRVNPARHSLKINDGTTGSDYGPKNALRDENYFPTLIGVSSSDFKTPTVVYGDSSGNLLIDSS